MSEIVVLAVAEAQLFELYNKLEDRREGLGDRFDADYRGTCVDLKSFPEIGPKYEGRIRRLLMRRWHVGLFYVIEGDRIMILGALDVRQSPRSIREQLGLI